jgi:hypothetical protein
MELFWFFIKIHDIPTAIITYEFIDDTIVNLSYCQTHNKPIMVIKMQHSVLGTFTWKLRLLCSILFCESLAFITSFLFGHFAADNLQLKQLNIIHL